ncbi:universal stress protein [Saccharothrix algeriensis]|uniref:Nucleotide-binding universal stress UspA family protein n=1 Tax=Saccharothrix algeriensis TaxID=173560 RepID=A0A8T8I001_9PSEU|nr:universal stress protein [Saccharothrix algeriensis]MBM7809707.1 nucleotide-binding universal stress UspA family protein [Saccharothrix algeriensis]QTR04001.1 universal stress protein [Saccharothrix algeriensis]
MILVGVDGSPASRKALRWALEQAVRTGDTVEATMAWSREPEFVPAVSLGVHPHADSPARRHPARELHSIVEQVRATVPGAPDVAEVTITGDAGTALTRASRQADLLVVGSCGHSPLAEVFLGSVAADCVRHTACPIVVVPPEA